MESQPGQRSTIVLREFLDNPKNKAIFGEFAGKYGPRIQTWCRSLGIQDVDSEDLAATILLRFFERDTFKDFIFEGKEKFDRWLRKTVKNAVLDFVRAQGRKPDTWSLGDLDAQASLEQVANEMADDLSSADEHDRASVEAARTRVEERVGQKTWQIFRMLMDEQRQVPEVAKLMSVTDFNVWKIRSRVLRMLREEVDRLKNEPEGRIS
jgi:RNA polymerase sigma factor (sigma-70 family)